MLLRHPFSIPSPPELVVPPHEVPTVSLDPPYYYAARLLPHGHVHCCLLDIPVRAVLGLHRDRQVWNMTFSFYQSLPIHGNWTVTLYRLLRWQ